MNKITAPFTPAQVEGLNKFQQSYGVHPFTCCSHDTPDCLRSASALARSQGKDVPYTDENEGVLIATPEGWICPCGSYTQDWAHEFMAKGGQTREEFEERFFNRKKSDDETIQ